MRKFEELLVFSSAVQKPSAMMKLALMRTATGKEDPNLPLLQRISSLELTAPQIAAQILTLLTYINNKRLEWAKKHKQWTLDSWKSILLV